MNVLVTGTTGFVGNALVKALLNAGDVVTAVVRNHDAARKFEWHSAVRVITFDIHRASPPIMGPADAVIHLAWSGLPNYGDLFHFEENLPANYRFIKSLVLSGYKQILVTGTCLEYGLKNGCLSESMAADPQIPYSIAKDTLRRFLESLRLERDYVLQWARLFYVYGAGQNPKSLLAQLDTAIDEGRESFDMSGGEQLRDYLHIDTVAAKLVRLLKHPELTGITNICSGIPISVRRIVEQRVTERNAQIKLNLAHFAYPEYEPMSFWGDPKRLDGVKTNHF